VIITATIPESYEDRIRRACERLANDPEYLACIRDGKIEPGTLAKIAIGEFLKELERNE